MQGDQNNQIVGEIQTPQPVAINAGSTDKPYGAQPVQPIMQQNIVYIQMPKFKHPIRIWSYVLIGVGISILFQQYFLLTTVPKRCSNWATEHAVCSSMLLSCARLSFTTT